MADFSANPRDPATIVTGLRHQDAINQTQLVAEVEDKIHEWQPEASPLLTLTSRIKDTRTVENALFTFMEEDMEPRGVTLAADSIVGDLVLDLSAGQGVRVAANYVLKNLRTDEQVHVASVATDAATVVRGIGSTQVDMVAGDTLVFMAPVFGDGSASGAMKSIQVDTEYNYPEIVRTKFGWTRRMKGTKLYGGKDTSHVQGRKAIEHKKSLEYRAYFGRRHKTTDAAGMPLTFTGGLDFFIRTNIWDLNGQLPTQRAFEEVLEEVMRWGEGGYLNGSSVKYLLCSSRWVTIINAWAGDKVEYTTLDKQIGFRAMKYISPHGDIMMIRSPILDEFHPDRAFLLDLNHITQVFFTGGRTTLRRDIQDNDVDGEEREYLTDSGMEVVLEGAHAQFLNLPV